MPGAQRVAAYVVAHGPRSSLQYRPARLPVLIVSPIQHPCKKLTAHTEYEMFAVNVSLLSEVSIFEYGH